jgi:predicted GNAT family acetyltransferase
MAGERMAAPALREVSGVCTRPGWQGRGFARRLMLKLIRRQLLRGETPFLHVMSTNTVAHALYLGMGFRDYCETVVRVVAPR